MAFSLVVLLILCIIIAVAKIAGTLFVRWGQPGVLGEILVGLILGPTLLNLPAWGVFTDHASYRNELEVLTNAAKDKRLVILYDQSEYDEIHGTPYEIESFNDLVVDVSIEGEHEDFYPVLNKASQHGGLLSLVKEMATVGVILLMFIAGLETSLKDMKRVGMVALFAAIGGVVFPFIAGWGIATWIARYNFYEALFIGTILTATSVSISAQTLLELKTFKSKEGTTILGSAIIDDILGIIILSLIIAFRPEGVGAGAHGLTLPDIVTNWLAGMFNLEPSSMLHLKIVVLIMLMISFFIVSWMVGIKYVEKLSTRIKNWPTAEALTAFAIFVCLFYSWSAEWIGSVASITGAYLAGLIFAQTKYKHEIEGKFRVITYSIFVPIFFVSIGLDADARPLFEPVISLLSGKGADQMPVFWLTIAIVVAAILSKIFGCYLGAVIKGFSNLSAFRVGCGMVSRGEVGLIIASVGLASGIIDRNTFTIMVVMVLVTTLITPVFLKIAFTKWQTPEEKNGVMKY